MCARKVKDLFIKKENNKLVIYVQYIVGSAWKEVVCVQVLTDRLADSAVTCLTTLVPEIKNGDPKAVASCLKCAPDRTYWRRRVMT